MTTRPILAERQQTFPAWVRIAAMALLAGYLLFAHGCHGDEDTELLDALPAIQGVKK
jgi:hypothetical protein